MTRQHRPSTPTAQSDGPARRTLVAGAAWTIPVVATAVGAPLAAASSDPLTLAFSQPSYSGTACTTITGASVIARRGSDVARNESITITLSDGYLFSEGGTTFTSSTGADGSLSLPTIKVPGKGGESSLLATSGSVIASAAVSAAPRGSSFGWQKAGGFASESAVPAGSTAIGWKTFLAPNGDLYFENKVLATGVTSAATEIIGGMNADLVAFTTASGAFLFQKAQPGGPYSQPAVPAGSTAIGWKTFLAPNGDLYFEDKVLATGVTSAATEIIGGMNADLVAFSSTPAC